MFEDSLNTLEKSGLLRRLRTLESVSGTKAVMDGRPVTLFCTNDYLGLSGHPEVTRAAMDAIEAQGFGSGSAPLIAGRTVHQARLESDISEFKGSESALVFGSGYIANTGIIPALARDGDLIASDSLNHASIIDGCRLARAEVRVYGHCDMGLLEDALKNSAGHARRWIVTEGVFSMDGDIAPLPDIIALADKYGAAVILDDAHGTGTMGPTGRGTPEHFGLGASGIVQMGTLGKALGSYGAFAAADAGVTNWLVNSARSFMFSTALPPAACAAASAALRVIRGEPDRILSLRRNEERLRGMLVKSGLDVAGGGTPIIPVIIGKADDAMRLSMALMDEGFFAPAIRPPTVPEGESRIRFTVSALHTDDEIDALSDAVRRLV